MSVSASKALLWAQDARSTGEAKSPINKPQVELSIETQAETQAEGLFSPSVSSGDGDPRNSPAPVKRDWAGLALPEVPKIPKIAKVSFVWQSAGPPADRDSSQFYLVTKIVIPPAYHLNRELLQIAVQVPDEGKGLLEPLDSELMPAPSGEAQGISYYTDSVELRQAFSASPALAAGSELTLSLRYQLCNERGNCFFPQTLVSSLSLPQDWPGSAGTEAQAATEKLSFLYWLGVLLLSLLGGIILNLMPCIFPIFSLKLQKLLNLLVQSLPSEAEHGRQIAVWRSPLYTLLGIELSFGILGLILFALWQGKRGLLWGFQLQQPLLVYGVLLLLFTMGLSLLGLFSFRTPQFLSKILGRLSTRSSLGNLHELAYDVGHGALIVVLGTPCSAPLLGPILGLYLLQDSLALALLGLFVIGLGLWLPYAVLAALFLRPDKVRLDSSATQSGRRDSEEPSSDRQGRGKRLFRFNQLGWGKTEAGLRPSAPLGGPRGERLQAALQALQLRMPLVEAVLGFVMLGAALYFYGVLQALLGAADALRALQSLLLLAWLLWLSQRLQDSGQAHSAQSGKRAGSPSWFLQTLFCASLSLFLLWQVQAVLQPSMTPDKEEAETLSVLDFQANVAEGADGIEAPSFLAYSGLPAEKEALKNLRQQGYGIFIEYTAAWCVTCRLNQARLLHTSRFREFLQNRQILYLKAELTSSNAQLESELNQLGRASLPVYLLYPAGREQPEILPTFLGLRHFG